MERTTLFLIILQLFLVCSSSKVKEETDYDKCLNALKAPKISAWSIFSSINVTVTAPDSKLLEQCENIQHRQKKEMLIDKYYDKKCKDKDCITTKQKLYFIEKGIPHKVDW